MLSVDEIEKITNEYYGDIYKFCVARCGNISDAEDITQETFLLFLMNSKSLENKNIRSYLLKTADNKLKEYFRQRKKDIRTVDLAR